MNLYCQRKIKKCFKFQNLKKLKIMRLLDSNELIVTNNQIKACDFIMLHLEDKSDSSSKLTNLHD